MRTYNKGMRDRGTGRNSRGLGRLYKSEMNFYRKTSEFNVSHTVNFNLLEKLKFE